MARLVRICRYPVKGLSAEDLPAVAVTAGDGVPLDRAFALARPEAPFDPALKIAARVKRAAMAHGLMVYPMSGTADGTRGDHVLLAPPFIVEERQLDELVAKLGTALDAALKSRVAA